MLNDLVEKSHGRNYNIKIMYDIGCLLTKHLRVKIFHKQYTITFLVSLTKNQNGPNSFEHMHVSQFLGIWTNGFTVEGEASCTCLPRIWTQSCLSGCVSIIFIK